MARRAELSVDGAVAHLRLVRDDAGNAIDADMVAALDDAVRACEQEDGVRALLVSADGPAFTVGGDLHYLAARIERLVEELDALIGRYHETLVRLAELPVPVVCAVQGGAAGGGLGLLWCSDVVLAADDVKLALGFSAVGLSGDGGSSWWLPRLVGMRRARQLMIGGRVLTAAEAKEWGLVDRVVPNDELHAEARRLALELAAGATVAYGIQRRLLVRSTSATLGDQLAAERRACASTGATADAREGISAFIDRRAPGFVGR